MFTGLDKLRYQSEQKTQNSSDEHGTENHKEKTHLFLFELNSVHLAVIEEEQEDQHKIVNRKQQDSPKIEMPLRILFYLREEQGVPKKSWDGEDDMKAYADAQRKQ